MSALEFWFLVALGIFAWCALCFVVLDAIGNAASTRDRLDAEALARQAADFDEPTRAAVEDAYGPLAMYGPSGEAYDGAVDLPRRGGVA